MTTCDPPDAASPAASDRPRQSRANSVDLTEDRHPSCHGRRASSLAFHPHDDLGLHHGAKPTQVTQELICVNPRPSAQLIFPIDQTANIAQIPALLSVAKPVIHGHASLVLPPCLPRRERLFPGFTASTRTPGCRPHPAPPSRAAISLAPARSRQSRPSPKASHSSGSATTDVLRNGRDPF